MVNRDRQHKNQRRMTMLKGLMRMTMLTPALAIVLPLTAQAADPAFCRGYATAALNQVRGALSNQNCARGIQGTRWSSDFKVHFDWCLTQPASAAEAERVARTEYLRGCRG
jgi:uncharacterized membrane protein